MALVESRHPEPSKHQRTPCKSTSGSRSESTQKTLVLDVKTRWNSTYLMLDRALELKDVCNIFCHRSEASKYMLSPLEWDKVAQFIQFLKPLNEATEFLCSTQYPTLNISLPGYISLMKQITQVHSIYDAEQLLPAAESMIKKLKKYLVMALDKTE
jgi:hypothetical protein